MKKIILSLAVIAFAGALVVGATGAFFTDTETSTGNTFTAGAIDLTIDNESYYNGVLNASTTWEVAVDLIEGEHLFFSFLDLKPGDEGEDTISIHVNSNDAYVCMDIDLTATTDNGQTEPELEDGDDDSDDIGELQDEINFVWWNDDGDNVLEDSEEESAITTTLSGMDEWTLAIADTSEEDLYGGAIVGGSEEFIAKAWCFGDLELAPVQDGENDPTQVSGITCDGSNLDNTTQTDSVEGTISFFAVQSRNNDEFRCDSRNQPEPEPEPI